MKLLPTIAIALLLGTTAAYADEITDLAAAEAAAQPQVAMAPVDPSEVHAVMIEVTIDRNTLVWTHAQIIGGYKDHDACIRGVLFAAAATSSELGENDIPVFLCPEITIESIKEWQAK